MQFSLICVYYRIIYYYYYLIHEANALKTALKNFIIYFIALQMFLNTFLLWLLLVAWL